MAASLLNSFVEELTRNTAVAALVTARIYPKTIPQDAHLPALAYQLISNPDDYTQSGKSGLRKARIQIDCVAKGYLEAHQLADAVTGAMSGKKNLSSLRANIFVANEFDRSEIAPVFLENSVQIDFEISYQEAG